MRIPPARVAAASLLVPLLGVPGDARAARSADEPTTLEPGFSRPGTTPDDRPPVELAVRVEGEVGARWRLLVSGAVWLPVRSAVLSVTSENSRATSVAEGDPGTAWTRRLTPQAPKTSRGANVSRFAETFDLAGGDAGDVFQVSVLGVRTEKLHLRSTLEVKLIVGPGGRLEAHVGPPAEPPGEDEPAPEDVAESEAVARPAREAVVSAAGATATITGSLRFKRYDGALYYCRECRIDVWDGDFGSSPDDFVTGGWSNRNGDFTLSWSNFGDEDGSRQDVYFKVWLNTSKFHVIGTNGGEYVAATGILAWDVPDGPVNLGLVDLDTAGDAAKAFWIYREGITSFWVMNDAGFASDGAVLRWPADGYCDWEGGYHCHDANSAHYHAGGEIHQGSNQYKGSVTHHEHGHHMMYKAYGDWWPWISCPDPHVVTEFSNIGCAWTEGWANFWALEVPNTTTYTWSDGAWINLENWTCSWGGCGANLGPAVEGRVAGALWDLRDGTNDGYDWGLTESRNTVIAALREGRNVTQDSIHRFRDAWKRLGYNAEAFDLGAAQNTLFFDQFTGIDGSEWGNNRLALVYRDSNNYLSMAYYSGTARYASGLGNTLTSATPTSTMIWDNRVDVFYRTPDGRIKQKYGTPGAAFTDGADLGCCYYGPDAAGWNSGTQQGVDVYARGENFRVYRRHWDSASGWLGWEDLGGIATSDPAACAPGPDALGVYVRGTDNALYARYKPAGGAWTGWSSLGGVISGNPDCAHLNGKTMVIVRGTDNGLYYRYYDGGWSGWTWIGSPPGGAAKDPTIHAKTLPDGTRFLQVWATTKDGRVYARNYFIASGWGPWYDMAFYVN